MKKNEVLDTLVAHRAEIEARFGVRTLSLFGSHARGEARAESDVDLLVEFAETPSWTTFVGLIDYLEELLGRRVDLVSPSRLKPRMRPHVEREMIRVA